MRSARPPITTMNMPENSAVTATAMFIRLASRPRSFCIAGAMFSVVWANSQNAITPMIIPNNRRSLPLKGVAGATAGREVDNERELMRDLLGRGLDPGGTLERGQWQARRERCGLVLEGVRG